MKHRNIGMHKVRGVSMKKKGYFGVLKIGFQVKPVFSGIMILLILMLALIPAIEIYFLNELIGMVSSLVPYQQIVGVLLLYILLYYLAPEIMESVKYVIRLMLNHYLDMSMQSVIMEKIARISLRNLENGTLPSKISHAFNSGKAGLLGIYENIVNMAVSVVSLASISLLYREAGCGVILICIGVTIWKEAAHKKSVDKDHIFSVSIEELERYCKALKAMLLERKNAPEILFNGVREDLIREWGEKKQELDALKIKHNALKRKSEFFIYFLGQLRTLLSFIFIGVLYVRNVISMTVMSGFVYAVFRIEGVCDSLMGYYSFLAKNRHIIAEIEEILAFEEESGAAEGELTLALNTAPAIEFKNVSYAYPNRVENALTNVSFCMHPYEKVALVGENGSGKSTIIRLLLGYDVPQSGKVLINGREAHLCPEEVRRNTAAMFQDYARFELSLKDNIIVSRYEEKNMGQRLDDAIKWAGLEEVIGGAKDGLDTDVVHGGTFSGGQWQKIAFARTRFRGGDLIVLDEPNAAVDAEYEVKMYRQFMELFSNATAVVVSHRLPVCQICDTIIYLHGGKILEIGSHRELLEHEDGAYANLFRAQAELYF